MSSDNQNEYLKVLFIHLQNLPLNDIGNQYRIAYQVMFNYPLNRLSFLPKAKNVLKTETMEITGKFLSTMSTMRACHALLVSSCNNQLIDWLNASLLSLISSSASRTHFSLLTKSCIFAESDGSPTNAFLASP